MTRRKTFKKSIRAQMEKTGQSFSTVRAQRMAGRGDALGPDARSRAIDVEGDEGPPLGVTNEEWADDEPCRLLWQNLTVLEHAHGGQFSIRFRGRACPKCNQPTLYGYWQERGTDFEPRVRCRTTTEHGREWKSCGYDAAIPNKPRPGKGRWPHLIHLGDEVRSLLEAGSKAEARALGGQGVRVIPKQAVPFSSETCPACIVGRLTVIRYAFTTARDFYTVPAGVPIEFEAAAALCGDCHALFSTDYNQRHSMLSHSLPRGSQNDTGQPAPLDAEFDDFEDIVEDYGGRDEAGRAD